MQNRYYILKSETPVGAHYNLRYGNENASNVHISFLTNITESNANVMLAVLNFAKIVPEEGESLNQPTGETREFAYFGYPDGGIGYNSSRRVMIHDVGQERTGQLRGYETTDGYQFKNFIVSKMHALRIVSERVVGRDKKFLDSQS